MSFVPMYLGSSSSAIWQSNLREAFAFSPTPAAIELAEAADFTDGGASGEGFDVGDISDDLEMHSPGFQRTHAVTLPYNALLSGARDTARIPTPLQTNHSRFLASARTRVRPRYLHLSGSDLSFTSRGCSPGVVSSNPNPNAEFVEIACKMIANFRDAWVLKR
jgi:hypothetical protein